ncbi:MAG: fumarate reductase subunit FrdD [Betaproteobacteria bacterium]|nr:MAG: fumarate reductase subunit FrdD [Betaproteobacteria bacterium]
MKRSNAPVFWALFGAGGMLAALIAPMLVFITGVAVPTGRLLPADAMSYERMLTLARNGFGKLALLLVVLLFMFHGGLRMYHSLHHLGFHTGSGAKAVIFGIAVLATIAAAVALLAVG